MHFGAILGSTLFLFVLAFILAAIEVESEGAFGWAYKMPTWYRTKGFTARLYGLCLGGKPLTGYHTFMFLLVLTIFHAGFFMGAPWSLAAELMALAKYLAVSVIWDFLWFVINPAFGMRAFTPKYVWWHAKSWWVGGLFPVDYLIGWMISTGLALIAGRLANDRSLFTGHLLTLAGLTVLTWLTMAVAPLLYHDWYLRMRRRDDRGEIRHEELDR